MSVAALESLVFGAINGQEVGTLRYAAESISNAIPNMDIVIILLGVLSAAIYNVPLVAASMGMYTFEIDNPIWHFIAYSAGTGSMLIIGLLWRCSRNGNGKNRFYLVSQKNNLVGFCRFYGRCTCFFIY